MGENLHDIDKLFKDSIDEHEEMPSGKVWDAIDNNLDKSNVIQIKRKYNNLKRIAIVLVLLLLGTVVYEWQTKKSTAAELANTNGNKPVENNGQGKKEGLADDKGTVPANETTTTVIQSNDNNAINNAGKDGKDNAANGLQQAEEKLNDKAGVNIDQSRKTRMSVRKPAVANDDAVSNEAAAVYGQGNKQQVKKSYQQKTKIKIRNGAAAEDIAADENGAVENDKAPQLTTAGATALTALQNTKLEKLPGKAKINSNEKISTQRSTPDAVWAAAKNTTKAKAFHFTLMPFYSPQFSFTSLKDDHTYPGGPQPRNNRDQIKKEEQHEVASSFGVLVEVPVTKKLKLQSGVTYLSKKISIESKKIYAKLDNDGKVKYRFDCSSGFTYIAPKSGTSPAVGDSISAVASTNTLQYLGIPLGLSYSFSLGKFNIVPSVGAAVNFLTKEKIQTELVQGTSKDKQTSNTIQGLKPTYFNAYAGVALDYNISKRLALTVAPSANFALSSINKDAAVKSYPNSFGIAAGVKIKF